MAKMTNNSKSCLLYTSDAADEELDAQLDDLQKAVDSWDPESLEEISDMEVFGDIDEVEPNFEGQAQPTDGIVAVWRLWSIVCPQKKLRMKYAEYEKDSLESIKEELPEGLEKYSDQLQIDFTTGNRKNYDEYGTVLTTVWVPWLNRVVVVSIPEESDG